MDDSGLALALDRASSTPPLDAHGVLVRRVRDLIDNDDLAQALSFITEVNKRMPGAPFAEVARCLYHLEKNIDGRALLLADSIWLAGRRRDEKKADFVRKVTSGTLNQLTDILAQLTANRTDQDNDEIQRDDGHRRSEASVPADNMLMSQRASRVTIDQPLRTPSVSIEEPTSTLAPSNASFAWGSAVTVVAMLIGACLLIYAFFGF